MKKTLWTGILAAALIFSFGTTSVSAAETQYFGCPNCYRADGTRMYYVDENGDGICDNFASGVCGGGYGCSTGWQGGVNQGRRLRNSRCLWHVAADGTWVRCVDADGNGVCDTCGAAISLRVGFIDKDNDGICDNFDSGICNGGYGGVGRQHGCHGGRRR